MDTRDVTLEKIDEVAKRTGIEARKFQKALGCFPEPTKIEQLYKTYEYFSGLSEEGKAVGIELDKLLLEELEKVTTIEEIMEKIWKISPLFGQAKIASEDKINKLLLDKPEQVTTIEEVKAICNTYLFSAKNKTTALLKWISLCVNINQLREIQYTYNSEEEKAIFAKRDELLLEELKKATTIEEVIKIYQASSDYEGYNKAYTTAKTEWHRLALERAKNATTFKESHEALDLSPINSEARIVASNKCTKFSLENIKKAKTIEELIEVYQNSLGEIEAQDLALTRIYDFLSEQFLKD